MKRRLPVLVERVLASTKEQQIKTAMEFAETVGRSDIHITCRVGCTNCCFHPFLITVSEAVLLHRSLVEQGDWTPELRKRIEQVKDKTRGLAFEIWLKSVIPCPLLTGANRCLAYKARPLHCRVTASMGDPNLCHPHRLGPQTPLVNSVDWIVRFNREVRRFLQQIDVQGFMMPVADALLIAEAIANGKLDIQNADQHFMRNHYA